MSDPPLTWPGGLCHMETRDIPSPKGLLICPDSPGLSDLCFYFPIQLTPSHIPPLCSFSLSSKKNIHPHLGRNNHHPPSIKGMASCSAVKINRDLAVRGQEEERGELGSEFFPHPQCSGKALQSDPVNAWNEPCLPLPAARTCAIGNKEMRITVIISLHTHYEPGMVLE